MSDKKHETEGGFYFSTDHNEYEGTLKVGYVPDELLKSKKPLNERITWVGYIRPYKNQKEEEKWAIVKMGERYEEWSTPRFASKFDTRVIAAWAVMVIYETNHANPLTQEIRRYIHDEGMRLRKERQETVSSFYNLHRRMGDLGRICKLHGIEFDFTADVATEVKELNDFMNQYINEIYEKFGKDWARTLRVLVKNVAQLADPEATLEI
jgi:hypothetical protein